MLSEAERASEWVLSELERIADEMATVYPEALGGDIEAAWRVLTLIDIELELLGVT